MCQSGWDEQGAAAVEESVALARAVEERWLLSYAVLHRLLRVAYGPAIARGWLTALEAARRMPAQWQRCHRAGESLLATIRDVARCAGVGLSTASRALRGQGATSAVTRARVEEAAAELGYVPDRAARTLRGGRSDLIGLLLGTVENPLWAGLATAVEDAAFDAGFHVVLGTHRGDADRERAYVDLLIQHRADGAVVLPNGDRVEQLERLRAAGVRLVIVGSDDCPGFPADRVWVDNAGGAYELTRHLLDHGHRRVAAIHGPRRGNGPARTAGFARALAEASLAPDEAPAVHADWTAFGGYRAAYELLADPDERPTALFVANNNMALGALAACRELGLAIPDDVALVNFDDIEVAAQVDPFLTVAADPVLQLGQQAVALLADRIAGRGGPAPRTVILPTRCIVRRSCGCPPIGAAPRSEHAIVGRRTS
jgi:DNA-binding LacI/PurR family transcriptional regulator